jgi:hypothetical protein
VDADQQDEAKIMTDADNDSFVFYNDFFGINMEDEEETAVNNT